MKKRLKALLAGLILIGSTSVSAQEELVFTNGQLYNLGNESNQTHYKTYHENGAIKGNYHLENGVLNGQAVFYDNAENRIELGFYKDGEKHGEWTKWDQNKNKTAVAHYHYGEKDGEWFIWDSTGQLRYQLVYDKGEKVGTWKMWNENGELVSEKEH